MRKSRFIRSLAPQFALRVWRKHGSLRNCKTGFDSSAGCCNENTLCPRSVPDFARELAKLVDQVRFLARTLDVRELTDCSIGVHGS